MATTQTSSRLPPPTFIALAGHPIRWRLLTELAHSDRHVNELTTLLGRPQALVSYHLGRLREGGFISSRRSAHDGRASYYTIDLQRCGDALSTTGCSLHPGLALRVTPLVPASSGRREVTRVLFACTGNGARSQIAEALLQQHGGERVEVVSAGSQPTPIHPNAIRVLAERGIDISDRQSKPLARFEGQRFDYVVTLCDKVREVCPQFAADGHTIHWSIADPSRTPGGNRASYPVFRSLAAELESRITFLIALIDQRPTLEVTTHARR